MSTLTSSDFGQLKRPTTRVHAPPGGGSSWSLGGGFADECEKPKARQPPRASTAPAPAPATIQGKEDGIKEKQDQLSSTSTAMNSMTLTDNSVETLLKTQGKTLRIALLTLATNETSQKFQQNCGQALCHDFGLDPSNVQEFKASNSVKSCCE